MGPNISMGTGLVVPSHYTNFDKMTKVHPASNTNVGIITKSIELAIGPGCAGRKMGFDGSGPV